MVNDINNNWINSSEYLSNRERVVSTIRKHNITIEKKFF